MKFLRLIGWSKILLPFDQNGLNTTAITSPECLKYIGGLILSVIERRMLRRSRRGVDADPSIFVSSNRNFVASAAGTKPQRTGIELIAANDADTMPRQQLSQAAVLFH